MGRVLTNNTGLQYAVEESVGVLPGSPAWKVVERNELGAYGATIETTARNPISKTRRARKGTPTDRESKVEFDTDLTMDAFLDFQEGFMFSAWKGNTIFSPTAVTSGGSGGFTVASGGAIAAGLLVYARGFSNAANNGLFLVQSGSSGTNVRVNGLTAEASPPAGATLEIVGVQGTSGDIQVNSGGNLIATTLDFTTLGLVVGQSIYVGGDLAAERFATDISSSQNWGYARVAAVAAGVITLDKCGTPFTTDNGSGKTIRLFFGRFIRDVDTDHADFRERSYQFEAMFPGLGSGGATEYEYALGNYCNEISYELPLADKASIAFGFEGTNSEDPTTSRKTNASSALTPNRTEAFNTSLDTARIRVQKTDETGITSDFKKLTFSIKNNVSGERVLGTLGPKYMNYGKLEVTFEAQILFTDKAVPAAIKANTTLGLDFALRNGDGAFLVDVPSMTLSGGDKEFPVNETVLMNTTGAAFGDPTLGFAIGVTAFGYVPARA